jgi:NAD(P)-dependent dehydrogenase (short-subunit alcohol dehydrogenase family)
MKTAVMGLTKTLALELANRRIRVNCIAPDMIFTEASRSFIGSMPVLLGEEWREQPLPDAGTVDDAARAVIFLAGEMSRFVTGTTLHLDGGNWASGGWKLHKQTGSYANV